MLKAGNKVTWKGSDDIFIVVKTRPSRLNGSTIVTVRNIEGETFDILENNLTPVEEDEVEDVVILTRSDFYGIMYDVETALFGGDDD